MGMGAEILETAQAINRIGVAMSYEWLTSRMVSS